MSDTDSSNTHPIRKLIDEINEDQAAADHAHAIETSRMRVIGLSQNYASLQVINEVNRRMPGDTPVILPDNYMDTAHEALDDAIVSHAAILGR